MTKRLIAILLLASPALAEEPRVDVTLSQDSLFTLATLDGRWTTAVSPLGEKTVGPSKEKPTAESMALLRALGLINAASALSESGKLIWTALAEPETAWQLRRVSLDGIGAVWYSEEGKNLWGVSMLADGGVRVFGPFDRATAAATIAGRAALPVPDRNSGLKETLSLEEMLVLTTLDALLVDAQRPAAGGPSTLGIAAADVNSGLLSPGRMQLLAVDPSMDEGSFLEAFTDGSRTASILDALGERGFLRSEASRGGRRFQLSEHGELFARAVLHPPQSLSVACLVPATDGVRAATARFCSSPTGLAVVRFSTARREFAVESLPQGPPAPAAKMTEILLAVETEAKTTPVGKRPEAAPKPAAGAAPATGKPLGEEIRAELEKGTFRAGTASRETWGRGRPDTTGVDADANGTIDLEYEDTDGDDVPDFVRVRDFPAGPFTRSFVFLDGKWQESNVLEASLEVNFGLPWGRGEYHPHNVNIVLNGKTVAELTDMVPEGLYRFPIRPQDLRLGDGAAANDIKLETTHLRGGHYVVSSGFNLKVRMSQVERCIVADSQEEAEKILRERAGLVASGIDPAVYVNEWRASPPAPQNGQAVAIAGPLRNQGMETAKGVVVRFYDGDPAAGGVKVDEKTVASLEAGMTASVEGKWVATPGEHRIFVVVSLPEGSKDLSEANSRLSLVVKTGGDAEPPALLVTEPGEGATVTGGFATLRGTAKDNVGLASLEYSVDGGLWSKIEVKERWEAKVPLGKGEHRVRVRLRDTSGLETEKTIALKSE